MSLFELPEHLARLAQPALPTRFTQQRSRGQGLVEYALIIALVAIIVIATLLVLGPAINNVFNSIIHTL